mmetsp:Transcript_70504/g.168873  ORF Transcript_70504/g.168873 Transcript_70504/m.168873 type:complete len:565 (+) Transcript_70504:34-1728(+)
MAAGIMARIVILAVMAAQPSLARPWLSVDPVVVEAGAAAAMGVPSNEDHGVHRDGSADPILLSETALHAAGMSASAVPDVDDQVQALVSVCEQTRSALEAPSTSGPLHLLGGAVYKACASALAASTALASQAKNAVDAMNVCVALVDVIAERGASATRRKAEDPKSGQSLCQGIAADLKAARSASAVDDSQNRSAIQVAGSTSTSTQPPPVPIADLAKAVASSCDETVEHAEAHIVAATDAMNLSHAVAPVCAERALKRLGHNGTLAAQSEALLGEWCQELEGRLVLALETGFFFVMHPTDAVRLVHEENPYKAATRHDFCDRFSAAVQRSVAEVEPPLAQASTPSATTATAAPQAATPAVSTSVAAEEATANQQSTDAPAQEAQDGGGSSSTSLPTLADQVAHSQLADVHTLAQQVQGENLTSRSAAVAVASTPSEQKKGSTPAGAEQPVDAKELAEGAEAALHAVEMSVKQLERLAERASTAGVVATRSSPPSRSNSSQQGATMAANNKVAVAKLAATGGLDGPQVGRSTKRLRASNPKANSLAHKRVLEAEQTMALLQEQD